MVSMAFGVNPVSSCAPLAPPICAAAGESGDNITMQLARQRFGIDSRTVRGKIQQIARAIELERFYNKDEILEAYLNIAPYGGNIEGVGAASLVYFHESPKQLSVAQALTLAVIPQSPA